MSFPNSNGTQEGCYRLYADFVNLNQLLKVQKHALPNINDFLALAHDSQRLSSLDVKDAFYNISVLEEDRHKLTISYLQVFVTIICQLG